MKIPYLIVDSFHLQRTHAMRPATLLSSVARYTLDHMAGASPGSQDKGKADSHANNLVPQQGGPYL